MPRLTPPSRSVLAAALALVLGAAGAMAPPGAGAPAARADADSVQAGRILDQVVATVDDEVILLSELLTDLQLYSMQSGRPLERDQMPRLLEESLEGRIREKLLVAKARRDEMQVGEDAIERALDQHVARLQQQAGGETRFLRELERQGLNLRDLRKRLREPMRDQLLVQRMLERIGHDVEVSDDEARAFFAANRNDPEVIPLRPQVVTLSHILILPRADSTRAAAAAARLAEVRGGLAAGRDFAELARAFSEGPAAARGGDLGWVRLEDVALAPLRQALAQLAPGEMRDDIRTEQGYHIVRVEERSGDRVRASQIFVSLGITEADRQRSRERAREAWRRLQDGADWAETVRIYSDDPGTRDTGGALPPLPEAQLEDRYADIVAVLEPGEFSSVFAGTQGYQIVRLDARDEQRPYGFDEIAERLRGELLLKKRNDALDAYVDELTSDIIVQRKPLPDLEEIAGLEDGP